MSRKMILLFILGLITSIALAANFNCTPQEREVFLHDSIRILQETDFNTKEMIVRWKKRYIIPRDKIREFERYVRNCEFRKVCQNHLYADNLQKRIESKMNTEELFRDSIYSILIPVCENKISGENISLTLHLCKFLNLDESQYAFLMDKAINMAHRMEMDRSLNVWNEEIDLIQQVLTDKQLAKYFYKKYESIVKKEVASGWQRLVEANMAEELDSIKDRQKATLYLYEYHKIKDLYRFHGTKQKKHLVELGKHMPRLISMLDALDKKKRIEEEYRNSGAGKEFVW